MTTENVYRKKSNGRYEPIGLYYRSNGDYLTDGLWYVRHHKCGHGTTNVGYLEGLFRIGGADKADLSKICGRWDLVEEVLSSKEFQDYVDNSKGFSFNDLCCKMLTLLIQKAEEIHEEPIY